MSNTIVTTPCQFDFEYELSDGKLARTITVLGEYYFKGIELNLKVSHMWIKEADAKAEKEYSPTADELLQLEYQMADKLLENKEKEYASKATV